MKKSLLLGVLVACLALTQACIDPFYGGGVCISGVGDIVTDEIELDSISSVTVETVIDVEIVQGNTQKVMLEGHENIMEELDLEVVNGELKIDLRNHCYNNFKMKVYLTLPTLKSVKVKSTGDVTLGGFTNLDDLELSVTSTGDIIGEGLLEVDGLTEIKSKSTGKIELELVTNSLVTYMSGTGNIDLSGSCKWQSVEMSGTGDYRALDFESEECEIESKGTGNAKLFVTEELDAEIKSVGDIYVKGDPHVSVYENSVGDLIYID